MLKKLLKLRKNEDGSEVVTFVIVVPLFMYIFALMVTCSQLIYAGSVGLNAANAGCRQAIVSVTRREAETAALDAAATYVASTGMGCSFNSGVLECTSTWERGHLCEYTVNVDVRTAVPLKSFSNIYTVTRKCTMMIERSGV